MSDPITAAQQLTSALDAMSGRLEAVSARQDEQILYGRRNRSLIRWLVASLILDVILTAGFVFGAIKINEANDRTDQIHNQQVATCVSSNDARLLTTQLWEYIFTLKPSTPRTDAQQKQIADLQNYVHRAFAPRDCAKS
jgi:hypothetical protein